MKKAIFLDRDGTLIVEPKDNYQIDSLEKLSLIPGVISALRKISTGSNYQLVMITNQDGLGTDSFPEEDFWPAQNKMLDIFKSEGIEFSDILIDKTFEKDGADTRKPGTGLLAAYMDGSFDLEASWVVGDRLSDLELAKNLGAIGLLIGDEGTELEGEKALTWPEITDIVLRTGRESRIRRETKETSIEISLRLDGSGGSQIATGLAFFDHMLEQIARHSGVDLVISVDGDLEVDEHHTIEDTALALGEAFKDALGEKRGIKRYGFLLPMDEALAQVALDFSGRPWLVWDAEFKREKVGDMPTEMFKHFFKSFSDAALCNLNIKVEGENEHHMIESVFKAFGKSIGQAIARDMEDERIPSTKGVL